MERYRLSAKGERMVLFARLAATSAASVTSTLALTSLTGLLVAACSTGVSTTGFAPDDGGGAEGGASVDAAVVDASRAGVGTLPGRDAAPDAAVCGNNVCEPGESCIACPNDCGQCPSCGAAPSCSQGLSLPSQTGTLSFDELSAPVGAGDAGVPDGGFASTDDCDDAQLRLRISHVAVGHQGKEVWLPTGTISGPAQSYYCIVQASDGTVVSSPDAGGNGTVEVALTKPTASIPDFGGADFGTSDAIFWGQAGPRLTQTNLTVTYSCFQQAQPGSNSFSAVLAAAGMAAGSLASAGPYGWAFGVGDVALQTVAAAIAAAQQQGDWHMFDVTQTIDESWLLPMTNGQTWSFTQSGGDSAFHDPWSLTLTIESWGCANVKPGPTP
jgi:hypothetical protein